MNYSEALLYGAVQGVAEYLPISSSAHLILLPKFLGERSYGLAFDVFLHLGTLLATLIYFWKDWQDIFATMPGVGKYFQDTSAAQEPKPGVVPWTFIAIATVPALIVGAIFHQWISTALRGNGVIIVTLVIGGLALFISDYFCQQRKSLKSMSIKDALWIGIAQCFALIPGVSRSGATMTGGRFLAMDRAAAARFSFLLSAPVTAAAVIFELRHWDELLASDIGFGPLMTAGLSSFVFGMLTIGGLLQLLRRFGFFSFALYRVALAFVIYRVLGI